VPNDPPWKRTLLAAAAEAPAAPGVYFFLDDVGRLLYIGKAKDLPARLRQHAQVKRGSSGPAKGWVKGRYPAVRTVRWEVAASEADAAAREADLIVALRPRDNAWTETGTWSYLVVTDGTGDRLRFALTSQPPESGRAYGCFPHLGKGVMFAPAIECSDGYTALLRLLWAASGEGTHVPTRITRAAPLEFEAVVDPVLRPRLHRLLAGTSDRVLDDLAERSQAGREGYLQPGLRRDRELAAGFYTRGTRALHQLRRRHARPPDPLPREAVERLLFEEVAPIIGRQRWRPPGPTRAPRRRRARRP
jgi:hypothetical protein